MLMLMLVVTMQFNQILPQIWHTATFLTILKKTRRIYLNRRKGLLFDALYGDFPTFPPISTMMKTYNTHYFYILYLPEFLKIEENTPYLAILMVSIWRKNYTATFFSGFSKTRRMDRTDMPNMSLYFLCFLKDFTGVTV